MSVSAAQAAAFAAFEAVEVPLDEFRDRRLPGLTKGGVHVGLNRSGKRATDYDLPAADVEQRLAVVEGVGG